MPQKEPGNKEKHQRYASWIFGVLLLIFYLSAFLFFQDKLPSSSIDKMLALISALLAGFLTYFMTGELSLKIGASTVIGKIALQAVGSIGVFALVLWWWTMPNNLYPQPENPVKPPQIDQSTPDNSGNTTTDHTPPIGETSKINSGLLTAYVWNFTKPDNWKDNDLADRFMKDFRGYLVQKNCITNAMCNF